MNFLSLDCTQEAHFLSSAWSVSCTNVFLLFSIHAITLQVPLWRDGVGVNSINGCLQVVLCAELCSVYTPMFRRFAR